MERVKIKFAMIVLLSLAANLPFAQGRGNAKGRNHDAEHSDSFGDKVRRTLPASEPVFTAHERYVINRWFSGNRSSLPPGLAKRDRLPPGLEKQLRERGTLPPGLQKKMQPLPWQLERQLGRLPAAYRRVIIGNNVILMNEKTALIYDIIRSVIP